MYQLFTGELPFKGQKNSDIKRAILEEEPIFPDDVEIHPKAKDLITSMLEKDKQKRIKMLQILDNEWLFPKTKEDSDEF